MEKIKIDKLKNCHLMGVYGIENIGDCDIKLSVIDGVLEVSISDKVRSNECTLSAKTFIDGNESDIYIAMMKKKLQIKDPDGTWWTIFTVSDKALSMLETNTCFLNDENKKENGDNMEKCNKNNQNGVPTFKNVEGYHTVNTNGLISEKMNSTKLINRKFAMKDLMDIKIFDKHGKFITRLNDLNTVDIVGDTDGNMLLCFDQEVIEPLFMRLKHSNGEEIYQSDYDKCLNEDSISFKLHKLNKNHYKMIGKAMIRNEFGEDLPCKFIVDDFIFADKTKSKELRLSAETPTVFSTVIECLNGIDVTISK